MKIKCQYCDNYVSEQDERCPSCGGTNPNYKRNSNGQPQTIEELKAWYVAHNLPHEDVTRFYIGKNVTKPKAFGIYQDVDGNFVVYKNKADGSRAERYRGNDEPFAVNELYQKLRETVATQKSSPINTAHSGTNSGTYKGTNHGTNSQVSRAKKVFPFAPFIILICIWGVFSSAFFIFFIINVFSIFKDSPSEGYYKYNNHYYYNQSGSYYEYDTKDDDWIYYGASAPFNEKSYSDYYVGGYYSTSGISDFSNSNYYKDSSSYSYSYDNDYDYDYDYDDDDYYDSWDDDDWDSGWDSYDSWDSDWGSDWDSDW